MAAMTASVASSPIFLTMASSPFANSVATYDVAGSAPRRFAIVRVSRRRTSLCFVSSVVARRAPSPTFALFLLMTSCAVNGLRVLQYRVDDAPGIVFEPLEETAVPSGMTGDAAGLFDDEQNRVVVAIEQDFTYPLHVAGRFPLAPQLAARARPVVGFARCCSALERVAIHPSLREHGAGVDFLRDCGHQSVGVPVHCVEPFHGGWALIIQSSVRFYAPH